MSNSTTTIVRSPRLTAGPIEAAKAAAALAPDSVAKITSRYVDMIDPIRFDRALILVQQDDDSGSLSGHAYHARLKIEDQVEAARAARDAEPAPADKAKPTKVVAEAKDGEALVGAARVAKAVEMREAGSTLQQIADALGYSSRQSARGVIVNAMKSR